MPSLRNNPVNARRALRVYRLALVVSVVLLLSAIQAGMPIGSFVAGAQVADAVWVDDALPAGAIAQGLGEVWNWVGIDPVPFSGSLAHQSSLDAGLHQHFFTGATETLTVQTGDTLMAYVYLDPDNPPSEVSAYMSLLGAS